ncbi:hypothetical protein Bca52824_019073 [Brassica carinata]|uniref:Uncharacterized protein n=1 Tax=Brassica carinata TaxID=52824 RepID=A0A8X7VR72_BRACI|nr:hypothetical protein Bca52824_019073 [Brassica carinata]
MIGAEENINKETPKHESESDVKPEVKVSSNSETTVQSAGDNDGNGSSEKMKAKDEGATSVVRQWARELDEKVTDEAKLSVLIYHGGCRTKDPVELAKYDVVVTTYAIVTNEVPKESLVEDDETMKKITKVPPMVSPTIRNGKLQWVSVGWFRVVLDEAQTIKNHRTQVARACCGLRAKRRWCLSGTPIQNTIDDLYSYFRFLRYDPYAVYKSFYNTIKVPISRNSQIGYKKLQAILKAIMLRRTKETLLDGQPIINLPPKTINLSKVDFSVEERSFYTKLEAESQSQFKAYADAGTLNQNYANILLMLLRLRQACDHPQLVKGFKIHQKILLLLCVAIYSAISVYQNTSQGMRTRALEFSSSKIKTVLDILQSLSNQGRRNSAQYGQKPSSSQRHEDDDDDVTIVEPTTLHSSSPSQGPIKTIVFSQWTGMLDLVELSFVENGIECRRLDGTMSLAARDRAVKEFSKDPDVEVMLMSLKAGNLGLNMVAACHVILLDLWWNPTTEDQAVDRAHRIGQTRPVSVTRVTIKDTIEDQILSLQEKKRKMVASAFGEEHGGSSASRLTVDDLKFLFMA